MPPPSARVAPDAEDAGIAVMALDLRFVHVPHSAVDLQGGVEDAAAGGGRGVLANSIWLWRTLRDRRSSCHSIME